MAKVNQQYIARKLGISRSTVSRCFTNHPGINPVTRARVFELAAQQGYQHMEMRNQLKPTSVPSHESVMGVLVCFDKDEFNRDDIDVPGRKILEGISEFAQKNKYQMDLHFLDQSDLTIKGDSYNGIRRLKKTDWAGALLVYSFPYKVVESLALKFPIVSMVQQYGAAAIDSVDADNNRGVSILMDHLYSLNHRRIGFYTFNYPLESLWVSRRYSAYLEKMVRLGLPYRANDVINMNPKKLYGEEESIDVLVEAIEKGVTSFICAADHQAYFLMWKLEERGIRVPEDVSICGFDGVVPPVDRPQVATVRIPYRDIGFIGARRLDALTSNPYELSQSIMLECQFVEGVTTKAV